MNVLGGERFEQRRILREGRPEWSMVEGERLRLMDGRSVLEAEATYLPPCEPTKILCIHLNSPFGAWPSVAISGSATKTDAPVTGRAIVRRRTYLPAMPFGVCVSRYFRLPSM